MERKEEEGEGQIGGWEGHRGQGGWRKRGKKRDGKGRREERKREGKALNFLKYSSENPTMVI